MRKTLSILILVGAVAVSGYSQKREAESAAWGSRTGKHKDKLGPELLNRGGKNEKVDVIVQFRSVDAEAHHAKVQAHGGEFQRSMEMADSALYSVPASELDSLADDDDVLYVSPNRTLKAAAGLGGFDKTTNYAVQANVVQNWGVNGTGFSVAVIDSGIQDSNDLKASRIVYRQDWTKSSVKDAYGHGTHVAGIIASTNAQYGGIAQGANLVDLVVLDKNGEGKDSDVVAAINTAISLKSKYNIVAINLSLGRPVFESYKVDPLCQAVEKAWKAGIVVVVAAGNDGRTQALWGYGTINSPGNDPYVLTVGALKTEGTTSTSDDLMTTYSSKGPSLVDFVVKPDLVAPGNLIVSNMPATSTLYKNYPKNVVSPGYFTLSGTSMATPVVTGAILMMKQRDPSLSPDLIKARLMKTATKTFPQSTVYTDPATHQTYVTVYDIFTVGAGCLDILAAMNNYDWTGNPATSPSLTLGPAVKGSSLPFSLQLSNGSSVAWGSSAPYANSLIWGSNISGSSVAWGSSIPSSMSIAWGSSVPEAFSLIWGSSSNTQAASLIWGSSLVWGAGNVGAEDVTIVGEP